MRHIETPRLLLRELVASDIPALVALWTDPQVTRHMGGPRNADKVRQTWEAELRAPSAESFETHQSWTVVEKISGHVIGDCGLTRKDVDGQSEVELTYVFVVPAWGKGYATEAARALRDYAFGPLGLSRIIALVDPANTASARVAEKVGLHFEEDVVRTGGAVKRVYAMAARTF